MFPRVCTTAFTHSPRHNLDGDSSPIYSIKTVYRIPGNSTKHCTDYIGNAYISFSYQIIKTFPKSQNDHIRFSEILLIKVDVLSSNLYKSRDFSSFSLFFCEKKKLCGLILQTCVGLNLKQRLSSQSISQSMNLI